MEKLKFKYGVNESPKNKYEFFLLSLQHVFAMFGSTILVPTLIGIDIAVALLTAGIGTLIYSVITQKKVPVFIGSSFAYIGLLTLLNNDIGTNGVANAVMAVGIIYILISIITRFIGTKWLDKILPPVVIGPVIIIIGLSLAPTAISNSGLSLDAFNIKSVIISMVSLLSTTFALLYGSKTLKSIPIMIGIVCGYIVSILLGEVDLTGIFSDGLFGIPDINIPFINYDFNFDFNIFIMVLPLVFVTLSEHIGDHVVSGNMLNKNFLKDPGLSKTILGDGLATFVAGLLGGPVNTTYAENTSVILLTRIASVSIIRFAAILTICLAFLKPVINIINTIPISVMGGISIILFGLIAQNGIKVLVNSKIDFTHSRNMIILSVILVIGLGNAGIAFSIGGLDFEFTKMALAIIVGIIFHLILPNKKVSYGNREDI